MHFYISTHIKFAIASLIHLAWGAFSIWAAQPWYQDLSAVIGPYLAAFLIAFIAIIPGCMNAFVFVAILLDKRPQVLADQAYPPVTILIAAFNEEEAISSTLQGVLKQDYSSHVKIIVIDDGSSDATVEQVKSFQTDHANLELLTLKKNGGKAAALNQGLHLCTTDIVISLDADSYLLPDSVRHLVGRYLSDPTDTAAVAGEILIRNSRENWITKAQEWDYFLGIASIKRIQSLFHGTLVAQGAFSLYNTRVLKEMGGWSVTVSEDIVLTWKLLAKGYRIGHAENALAFTICPNTLTKFIRQRQRWSRGLIEAFKANPKVLITPRLSTIYIYWNTLFPLMDIAYTLGFIPGVILACFGIFWIAGSMTLAILPMAMLLNLQMYLRGRKMFANEHLHI